MATHFRDKEDEHFPHRGRIQAQGGGTEESVPWAQDDPPTERQMLELCDQLMAKLTPTERRNRDGACANLRGFIRRAAKVRGVVSARKSFFDLAARKRGSGHIRIDIEVISGMACVPDVTIAPSDPGETP